MSEEKIKHKDLNIWIRFFIPPVAVAMVCFMLICFGGFLLFYWPYYVLTGEFPGGDNKKKVLGKDR